MKYYNADDIVEITGVGKNKAYDIIRTLQKQFKKQFPDSVFIQGKIAKWYFDETMGINKGEFTNEKEYT